MSRPHSSSSTLHALAWLGWAVASVVCVQLAPNPWYVAIVVATAVSIGRLHGRPGPMRSATGLFLVVGIVFAVVRVSLVALTTHGVGPVLFRLPAVKLPVMLGGFTLGGTIEKPVVLQELNSAWVVVGVLVVFGAFNAVVSHHELIRLLPRAFHEVGVVLTIGLAFLPMVLQSIAATREADLARTGGRLVRRGRLLRTLVPVVESALERAVLLAESMDSRGFGRGQPSRRESGAAWLGLVAALGMGAAVVALIGRRQTLAALAAGASVVLLLGAVTLAAPAASRYRARRLRATDAAMLGLAGAAPVAMVVLARMTDIPLTWNVYDGTPQLSVLVAACLVLLCAPLALRSSS